MSDNSDALYESLAAMSRFFVGETTLKEALDRVADLACRAVPGADAVGITMMVDGRPRTTVFTDETAPKADSAQYETGRGPCLEAFRTQQVCRIDSLENDDRWPEFAEAAAAHGVRSTLSLPLVADRGSVGALNIYSRSEAAFTEDEERLGATFAAQASIVLANVQAYWEAYQLGENLAQAMKSRAAIEQAKGIIMATRGCDAEEAFQILVRASQRENRKLRDIAHQIVASTKQRGRAAHSAASAS
ncbi:MAG TPA: GAF and ANTAR domain-containing protein [Acidimicrobiales bacterium]|nr:GAF and ANTAR domain-containing protein [Acidimicrobiales bacterium]